MTPIPTAAERIGRFVTNFSFDDIGPPLVEKTKDHIAHLIASGLAGHGTAEGTRARHVVRALHGSYGRCTVIGQGQGSTAAGATLANSIQIAAPGTDDILLPAGVHPGQVTLPAALALAEQLHRSGRDLITAMVAGYEVLDVLGGRVWTWDARTPHRATVVFGAFGPAAACASILRLTDEASARAIGFAAYGRQGLSKDPFSQYVYGFAACNGLTAAILADKGATHPQRILEGPRGFFDAEFGRVPDDLDDAIGLMGSDPAMGRAALKYYPTTGMNINAVQLLIDLARRHRLTPADIEEIRVTVSSRRKNHHVGYGAPPYTHRYEAVSSIQFNLALALTDGEVRVERYDDFADPALAETASRVTVLFAGHPDVEHAALEITTADGRRVRREQTGFRFRPTDRGDRLRAAAGNAIPLKRAEGAAALLDRLEDVDDVGALTAWLRPS